MRGGGPDERLDSEGAVPELKRSGERAVRRGCAREAPIAGGGGRTVKGGGPGEGVVRRTTIAGSGGRSRRRDRLVWKHPGERGGPVWKHPGERGGPVWKRPGERDGPAWKRPRGSDCGQGTRGPVNFDCGRSTRGREASILAGQPEAGQCNMNRQIPLKMMKYGIHTWRWPLCSALLLFAAQPLRAAQAFLGASTAAEVRSAAPSSERSQRAEELLRRLVASIRALGDYGVSFAVESGDQTVEGHYSVSGNRYSMTLGDAEVFCDGKVRYEVDHRRREVVIDRVNESSRNIVDNPTRAFEFLDAQYRASLVSEAGSCAVVRLTPAEGGALPVGSILLEVDTSAAKPRSLTYDFDGEQVVVRVSRIAAEHAALRTFDASACKGYEFIDFR